MTPENSQLFHFALGIKNVARRLIVSPSSAKDLLPVWHVICTNNK